MITETPSLHQPSRPSITKTRNTSITGGLPYLLLSVLPPVIPRASWPSAEYMQVPMRRSVTFASQPQLENGRSINDVCLPAADLFNLRLAHQQATETKGGLINRIRGIFSRHSSSNKGSSGSLSGTGGGGSGGGQTSLKAAFKSHMGMFSRLIPNTETASCNALYNQSNITTNPIAKSQFAKSGTDIDRITIDPDFLCEQPAETEIGKYIQASETKVNFQLPFGRRPSIATVQPTLRERVKGSPRFPHRILPTTSLTALEEQQDLPLTSSDGPKIRISDATTSGNWKSLDLSPNKYSHEFGNYGQFTATTTSNGNDDHLTDPIYVIPDMKTDT